MKTLILIFYAVVLIGIVFTFIKVAFGGNPRSTKKNVRNFVVRFDPAKEKYYIANQLDTHDEDVTNWMGNRIYYTDKPKAEFVVQKLN
jgi:hypothetical protein